MKIAILMPKVDSDQAAVATRVIVEGAFLGLIDSPGKGGVMWRQDAKGRLTPLGGKNLALAVQVPSRTHHGSNQKLRAESSAGDILYVNPCCILVDMDTPTTIWNPRNSADELGQEHRDWLENYPEWASAEIKDPRWLIALKNQIAPRQMAMVNRRWSQADVKGRW